MFGPQKTRVFIGGLFPLSGGWWSPLGHQCLKAARLAIADINNNQDIIPNIDLVLSYNDTQASCEVTADITWEYTRANPPLLAAVGGLFSSPTLISAQISSDWKLTQVSYGATTPKLDDKSRYPYFLRTISSVQSFKSVYLGIVNKLGSNKVATIHEKKEPFPGITRSLDEYLRANGKTVYDTAGFYDDPIPALQQIKNENIKVILGNFFEDTAKIVFCEAHKLGLTGPDFQWVVPGYYTPGWWEDDNTIVPCSHAEMMDAIEGYMTVGWGMMNRDDDTVTVSGMTPREFRQRMNLDHKSRVWPAGHQILVANSYDAVWAVALALDATLENIRPVDARDYIRDKSRSTNVFHDQLSRIDFVGVSGQVDLDGRGDNLGLFVVQQFRDGAETTIGLYDVHNAGRGIKWAP